MGSFESLDSDIIFNVLSRIPTKNLVESKLVSKGWQKTITDHSFVAMQLKRRESVSGFLLQQRYEWCSQDIETINYIPVKWGAAAQLQKKVFDFLPQDVVLLTASNGLVCCRSCFPCNQPCLFVCNPVNKQWVKLDWSETSKEDSISIAFDPCQDFSANSSNFKLVRVYEMETEDEELYFAFGIYSSKTMMWKLSEEICRCNSQLHKKKGIYIGGFLHWLTQQYEILSFNVENELAWLIPAPVPAMGFDNAPQVCIGESNGKLHYVMISEELGLQVWILEDYFEFKWSVKLSKSLEEMEQEQAGVLINLQGKMKLLGPGVDPLAFKDGVLLLRVSNRFYLYDIEISRLEPVCEVSEFGTYTAFTPIVLPYTISFAPLP